MCVRFDWAVFNISEQMINKEDFRAKIEKVNGESLLGVTFGG